MSLTGRSSIHVSPAAILNMHTKALSNLRNWPGARVEKKLTPKIASAATNIWMCAQNFLGLIHLSTDIGNSSHG